MTSIGPALLLLLAQAQPNMDEFPRTTSVLVEQGGKLLHERYYRRTDVETLHDPRSVGKSVTGLAVGIAIADKKIPSVDAPAFGYLQDLRPFAGDGPGKARHHHRRFPDHVVGAGL